MRSLFILILLLPSLAYSGQGGEYVRTYLSEWLKTHQFEGYTKGQKGILLKEQGVILNGEIYEVKEITKGKLYSVETQFSLAFPDGRRLEDFVAGAGKNPDEAFLDSLQNFCLTTFHPIYAGLIENEDPHVRKETWKISKNDRNVYISDWGTRGEKIDSKHLEAMEKLLAKEVSKLKLTNDIHWAKVVVGNVKGESKVIVFTIDGMLYEDITEAIKSYSWPASEEFYMVKLFFVIGKA